MHPIDFPDTKPIAFQGGLRIPPWDPMNSWYGHLPYAFADDNTNDRFGPHPAARPRVLGDDLVGGSGGAKGPVSNLEAETLLVR
jgi:hypothetical protein